MCFFGAPPSNVPINWLVKWVVLTSQLEWNYDIFSKIIPLKFLLQFLRNYAEMKAEEKAHYLLVT